MAGEDPTPQRSPPEGAALCEAVRIFAEQRLIEADQEARAGWAEFAVDPPSSWEELWKQSWEFDCSERGINAPANMGPIEEGTWLPIWRDFVDRFRAGDPVATAWFDRVGEPGERRVVSQEIWKSIEPPSRKYIENSILKGGGRWLYELRFSEAGSEPLIAVPPPSGDNAGAAKPIKGGRQADYDWDAFDTEIVRIANTHDGLPETIAEMTRKMQAWCVESWGREPAESTVKKYIRRIWPKA